MKSCANGDGRPVCPPSKVICRECMGEITATLESIFALHFGDDTSHCPHGRYVESYCKECRHGNQI